MRKWAADRTVRSAVLRHLLITDEWPVDATGVRLRGVRISGLLDLEAAILRCPLRLEDCYFDAAEPVCLDYATASRVILTGCLLAGLSGEMLTADDLALSGSDFTGALRLTGADIAGTLRCSGAQLTGRDPNGYAFDAQGIKVGGNAYLDEWFKASAAVKLAGADITGTLRCSGAQLTSPGKTVHALDAGGIKVGGSVHLDAGFTASGAVRLAGADITGNLWCRRAQLAVGDEIGYALHARGIKVGGDAHFDEEFTATGAVRLGGAVIGGDLLCSGARLTGRDKDGYALYVQGIKVGGDTRLDGGFTASGAVWLAGADITGNLWFRSAQLIAGDKDGDALVADGMKAGGGVYLDGGFTAAGTVSLVAARVSGSVLLAPAKPMGTNEAPFSFIATRAQIADALRWAPAEQVSGQVNLEGATVGELEDDWSGGRKNGCWPVGGRLRLDGFTYGRFSGQQQAKAEQRLAWIHSQYQPGAAGSQAEFASQPYEQLAAVYRRAGKDDEAREVAIARRRDLRKYGALNPYRRFGNWLLDWSIKYGYKAWRAGAGLAAAFVVFAILSFLAQQHHLMVPVGDTDGLHFTPSATRCTSSYPCFSPVGYAIDTVIPIINVHQAAYWGPDAHSPWGQAWLVITWIATGLGWALATLLVAGYTGLVRQN
jgi:hypothetical protein